MKQGLKNWFFRLLGKDPEGVVVTFCTGDPELCRRMVEEVHRCVEIALIQPGARADNDGDKIIPAFVDLPLPRRISDLIALRRACARQCVVATV